MIQKLINHVCQKNFKLVVLYFRLYDFFQVTCCSPLKVQPKMTSRFQENTHQSVQASHVVKQNYSTRCNSKKTLDTNIHKPLIKIWVWKNIPLYYTWRVIGLFNYIFTYLSMCWSDWCWLMLESVTYSKVPNKRAALLLIFLLFTYQHGLIWNYTLIKFQIICLLTNMLIEHHIFCILHNHFHGFLSYL